MNEDSYNRLIEAYITGIKRCQQAVEEAELEVVVKRQRLKNITLDMQGFIYRTAVPPRKKPNFYINPCMGMTNYGKDSFLK